MEKDYYKILGIEKTASIQDIKRAYRQLAHKYHPDKFGGDEKKFKEISEAYQVLSDPEKRKQYDQFGRTFDAETGAGPGSGGFSWEDFGFAGKGARVDFDFTNLGDIFDAFFTGGGRAKRNRGDDIEKEINLNLEDAYFGKEIELSLNKKVTCAACKGSGAEPGSKMIKCDKCGGSGKAKTVKQTFLGQFASISTCDKCEGRGKIPERICRSCQGSGTVQRKVQIKVKIPAGVNSGSVIRVPGSGQAGERGDPPGDLYLHIKLSPHKYLKRIGDNLIYNLNISFPQAALGDKVEIKSISGREKVKIPAGIESGEEIRLRGKGIPHLQGFGSGDLIIKVKIKTPKHLSREEKEIFEKLKNIKKKN